MKLQKSNIPALLDFMAKDARVFVPATIDGVTQFAAWQGEKTPVDFAAVNSKLPPKDMLFPQTEKMYRYRVEGTKIADFSEIKDEEKQIIFGIRSCDMASIDRMDEVFLTKGYTDEFYRRKRENLLTVAIGCNKVAPTCFCDSMGINPQNAPGADIQLHELDDAYLVQALTEKGEKALVEWGQFLTGGTGEIPATSCQLKVDMTDVPEKLHEMFHHPLWDKEGKKCIGCGTCTYLCPTCYCFDIDGEQCGDQGTKFRCWDSCMFSEYTRMAGGHNPRPSKKERVRNRFLHKLCYFHERYGKELCTGCGRCVAYCPVHLDITLFIDKVNQAEVEIKQAGEVALHD